LSEPLDPVRSVCAENVSRDVRGMPTAKPASDRATSGASPVSGSGVAGVAALVSVAVAYTVLWLVA
jgi:hypothetical protein